MQKSKVLVVVVIALLLLAFFAFDLGSYLNPSFLKQQQARMSAYYLEHPLWSVSVYFAVYVVMAALSLPGAVWVTLIGGAIFGVFAGSIVVSFASSIGATLAFLVARFLLRDWVQDRFGSRFAAVDAGMEEDGAF